MCVRMYTCMYIVYMIEYTLFSTMYNNYMPVPLPSLLHCLMITSLVSFSSRKEIASNMQLIAQPLHSKKVEGEGEKI